MAAQFAQLGASVLDLDRFAHAELNHPGVRAELIGWWGGGVVDSSGAVDRAKVATIVFEDPAELARLEGLLYPRLTRVCLDLIDRLGRNEDVSAIVLDAPKLFEAGLDRHCDAVVFVEADQATRLERVARSRGWDERELLRRENLQNPLDSKRENADYIVINCGSIEHLGSQVERVLKSVLSSFTKDQAV